MAEISAGTDPLIMPLDGPQNIDDLVITVLRTVVVDGDPDVELLHEIVKALEGLRCRIGGDRGDAGGLGELKHPAVGRGVAAETVDAVATDHEAQVGHFLLHGLDRGGVGTERKHIAVELDHAKTDVAGVPEGIVDVVAAERVELDAEVEAGGSRLAGDGRQGREGGRGEEPAAGDHGDRHGCSFVLDSQTAEALGQEVEAPGDSLPRERIIAGHIRGIHFGFSGTMHRADNNVPCPTPHGVGLIRQLFKPTGRKAAGKRLRWFRSATYLGSTPSIAPCIDSSLPVLARRRFACRDDSMPCAWRW